MRTYVEAPAVREFTPVPLPRQRRRRFAVKASLELGGLPLVHKTAPRLDDEGWLRLAHVLLV